MTTLYKRKDMDIIVNELKNGKVIAFPTDTVYGVGVVYHNEEALKHLKQIKGRPEQMPIPTMVGSYQQIRAIGVVNETAELLMEAFMPGALTLVVKRKENIEAFHTNGFSTVALRIPDDAFVIELIQKVGKPLLVSSANQSGGKNTFTPKEVLEQLDGKIDGLVVGTAKGSSASTIVEVDGKGIRILREGAISEEEIKKIVEEA